MSSGPAQSRCLADAARKGRPSGAQFRLQAVLPSNLRAFGRATVLGNGNFRDGYRPRGAQNRQSSAVNRNITSMKFLSLPTRWALDHPVGLRAYNSRVLPHNPTTWSAMRQVDQKGHQR